MADAMKKKQVCKKCGKTFDESKMPTKRVNLCSDCLEKVLPRWKYKDNLGDNVEDIAVKAIDSGMSYGKYVALEYAKKMRSSQ